MSGVELPPAVRVTGSRETDAVRPNRVVAAGGDRAVAPIVGVLLLVAVTVLLAVSVAVGVGALSLESSTVTAQFSLTADADRSSVTIEYRRGDPIDVEELTLSLAVDGTTLEHQPPVPFVGADGFDGAPTGPFNAADDTEWTAGERAGVVVAETNEPTIASGDSVEATVTVDGTRLATLETTAN